MNRLDLDKRTLAINLLVEGMSIAATSRITKASPTTITKLLEDVGAECSTYLFLNMVKLPCTRIQVDEIWSFCRMKERHVPPHLKGLPGYGDAYTWTAFCPDTKLVPCFLVGRRDTEHAVMFIDDLAWRLRNRIQLTSDGHNPYLKAVKKAFGDKVDFAMVKKEYGGTRMFSDGTTKKYNSSECSNITTEVICGSPDPAHISTSLVERQNRTMRMNMHRLTREVDAFSKKLWNHHAATALHYMHYNYARKHTTLKTSPAVAAGLAKHVWSIEDIVRLAA